MIEMKNKIKEFKNTKNIVSIFDDYENTDKFSAGFIVDISDDHILLEHVSPYGLYDGFMVKEIKNVYRITYCGKYERKLDYLYKVQKQSHSKIKSLSDSVLMNLLLHAQNNKLVTTVELFDSELEDIQGYVSNISEELIVFDTVDDYGKIDGKSIIKINDITYLTCDSDKEMSIKLLSKF